MKRKYPFLVGFSLCSRHFLLKPWTILTRSWFYASFDFRFTRNINRSSYFVSRPHVHGHTRESLSSLYIVSDDGRQWRCVYFCELHRFNVTRFNIRLLLLLFVISLIRWVLSVCVCVCIDVWLYVCVKRRKRSRRKRTDGRRHPNLCCSCSPLSSYNSSCTRRK